MSDPGQGGQQRAQKKACSYKQKSAEFHYQLSLGYPDSFRRLHGPTPLQRVSVCSIGIRGDFYTSEQVFPDVCQERQKRPTGRPLFKEKQ